MESNEKHVYWVGPRHSDICFTGNSFFGSITIFGNGESLGPGKGKNQSYCGYADIRRNHNVNDEAENDFFFRTIKDIIESDPDARFLFYNPNAVYYTFSKEGVRLDALNTNGQFLCLNGEEMLKKTNNKRFFLKILEENDIPHLCHKDVTGEDGDYNSLLRRFGRDRSENLRFIFQAPVSSGGEGTFIVSESSNEKVIRELERDETFFVSVYEAKNVPLNIHAIIFRDNILLTPGSVQIIREGANNRGENRLLYRGADFIAYQKLPEEAKARFENAVMDACKIYQKMGYRGVCGIDGILCGDKVYLLEMNNRFQASTSLINRSLQAKGLPSIQQLNLAAFNDEWDPSYLSTHDVSVNYSNFSFTSTDEITELHAKWIHEKSAQLENASKHHVIALEDDGVTWEQKRQELAYLFRIVFDKSITSVGPDGEMFINENIVEPNKKEWYDPLDLSINKSALSGEDFTATRDFYLRLKIALLVQGVTFSKDAVRELEKRGDYRQATNNAIDLRINVLGPSSDHIKQRYLIINAPTDVTFVQLSPFTIRSEIVATGEPLFVLYYYGRKMFPVGIYYKDPIPWVQDADGNPVPRKTSGANGAKVVDYEEVAFLSTDRLRVHVTNNCIFKHDNKGCRFCNIIPSEKVIDAANIEEVVAEYCNHAAEIGLTHFLVGGQTAANDDQNLIEAIQIIRKHARYADIYAMITPHPFETLKKMYSAGLNQLSCNIEVFDDEIAKKYMPGKRSGDHDASDPSSGFSRKDYLQCLRAATALLGRRGNVRTMVIVGLEPYKSLKKGIEDFTSFGIQPILSIFRPLPKTPMEHLQAPPMAYLVKVYNDLQSVCKQNGLLLGPDCVNCQNNTLALPAWLETP